MAVRKVTVSWQKKKPRKKPRQKPVAKAKVGKLKLSNNPAVVMLRELEEDGPLSSDLRTAVLAGFRASHCTPENFNMSREIANVRLPDGTVKRSYACDVCGFVGSKVSKA